MSMAAKTRLMYSLAIASSVAAVFLFRSLAIEHFPQPQYLSMTYAVYFLATLASVHLLIIAVHLSLKESRGAGLSRQVPKYIDYSITAIIAIAAVQVTFASGSVQKYVQRSSGTTEVVLQKIRTQAAKHITNDCVANQQYFPPSYCDVLTQIALANDLGNLLQRKILPDNGFIYHQIGFVPGRYGGSPIYSPLRTLLLDYAALTAYSHETVDEDARHSWSWIAMLLLPPLVTLRVAKTTLELFFELS